MLAKKVREAKPMPALHLEAKKLIDKANKILVVSHRKPDADTLGTALCLKLWLEGDGKNITLACTDKPAPVFNFLPSVEEFVDEFDLKSFDLMIIVDAGASYMTNFHLKYEDFFSSGIPILNIDHHASNDMFGTVNIVDSSAASTTVILHRILGFLNAEITPEMATCLMAGIYGDTGSFMHSNTDKETYEVASNLMKKGASISDITKALFRSRSVPTLRLWGKVLENARLTGDSVVVSVVKEQDFREFEVGSEHLSGVVDYLNMVPNSKFAVLLNEDRKGHVKGSMRTRQSDVDVSKIAASFGGGGHSKASGFTLDGKLKEEIKYVVVSDDVSEKTLDFAVENSWILLGFSIFFDHVF